MTRTKDVHFAFLEVFDSSWRHIWTQTKITNGLYDPICASLSGMNYIRIVFCILCIPLQQFFPRVANLHIQEKWHSTSNHLDDYKDIKQVQVHDELNIAYETTNHHTIDFRNAKQFSIISGVTTNKSIYRNFSVSFEIFKQVCKSLSFASTLR
jgi:hypothetical protein